LLLAAAVFSLIAARNWAQNNEMNVQFHGFTDVRGVTVLSPTVDLTQDYTERTNLRINYGLDTISAASDSCVRCHNDGVNSHRQVFGLSATRKYNDLKLTIGGAYSKENFYRATTGLASVSRDLANGNTTVAGGLRVLAQSADAASTARVREPIPERRIRHGDADADEEHDRAGRLRGLPHRRLSEQSVPPHGPQRHDGARQRPGRPDAPDAVRAAAPGAAGRHLR
jgi:hypothetical protein